MAHEGRIRRTEQVVSDRKGFSRQSEEEEWMVVGSELGGYSVVTVVVVIVIE